MMITEYPPPVIGSTIRPPAAVLLRDIFEISALAALIALNWLMAWSMPGVLFSYTSLALFVWLSVLIVRLQPRAAILLAPVMITRLATMLSLAAIEAGSYLPEVNQLGAPGDASASFVAFTAIFFLVFAATIRLLERPLSAFARSPFLDGAVRLLAWPVVIACAAWGLLAFIDGIRSGFPLLAGIDRFFYRHYLSSTAILTLLDNKYLVAALLGSVTFAPERSRMLRFSGLATFIGMTALYFLFGDKFFTILTEAAFFLMPYLLPRSASLGKVLLRGAPITVALLAMTTAATLYIYSDYGSLPLDRTTTLLGERIAGQGELWYVANRDFRRVTHWDAPLVARNIAVLADKKPPASAFANGVETYYFIQHYSPAKLSASFRQNQGWVQLTMGYEAIGLVMFGYLGVVVLMLLAGIVVALCGLYLERAFLSAFPLSLFFAVWTYLQVYFTIQQGSLWTVAAPGQIKRFMLFFVIELILFAINRAPAYRTGRWRTAAPTARPVFGA